MINKNNVINHLLIIPISFLIFCCQNKKNKPKIARSSEQFLEYNKTKLYDSVPSFIFNQNGMYATGMLCVDLNKNDYLDVINANGNDMSPQPLTINNHWGKRTGAPYHLPNYANDIGFNTRIKAGDLNNDGWIDLIMITVFKREPFNQELYESQNNFKLSDLYRPGCVKVYMNNGGFIPSTATYEIEFDTFPFDIDLGDVDADGDLDLAIAFLAGFNNKGEFVPAKSFIYLNDEGKLKNEKIWETDCSFNALAIKFADVNLDGLLDLTLGHTVGHYVKNKKTETEEAITVFYGEVDENDQFTINKNSGWDFEFGKSLAVVSLDIGLLREGEDMVPEKKGIIFLAGTQVIEERENEDRALTLLNRLQRILNSTDDLDENFFVIGCEEEKVYWKTDVIDLKVNKPSFSSIGDVNNDGYADLIVGFLKRKGKDLDEGAPFFIFKGNDENPEEPSFEQIFRSKKYGVNQEIFLGYTRKFDEVHLDKIEQRKFIHKCIENKPVITLPCNVVLSIDTVTIDGVIQEQGVYSWNYATNVLILNSNIKNSVELEITYTTPLKKDIYISYWNPNKGNVIYTSNYVQP